MAMDGGGQIQPKCCPRCKTSIRTCPRYGDIIKSTYEDIAKAKKKIFNMRGNPQEFFNETSVQLSAGMRLLDKMNNLDTQKNSVLEAIRCRLNAVYQVLQQKKTGNGKKVYPSIGPDQRFQIQVNLEFMERALELMEKMLRDQYTTKTKEQVLLSSFELDRNEIHFIQNLHSAPVRYSATSMKPELANDFGGMILKLLRSAINRDRISSEENRAVGRELDRLDLVRAYYVLQSHPTYAAMGLNTPEKEMIERLLTKNIRVLKEEEKRQIKIALKTLGDKLRTGLGISDKERQEIVSAMGMSQGHWFKCPNGHIYAIGDCGGAMVESRCNECNALIGGANHRLLGDNVFAGEMDGASRPAWPPH